MIEAKPLFVDVLGFRIPIIYRPFSELECWGQAIYRPGCVEIHIAREATGPRLEGTIFHERLELALMVLGFDGCDKTKEHVICVAELILTTDGISSVG